MKTSPLTACPIRGNQPQRIFEEFMDGEASGGRIKASGYFEHPNVRNAYLNCIWEGLTGPGRPFIPHMPGI
jgi:hypothetical protein